jgi:hypothetical protein
MPELLPYPTSKDEGAERAARAARDKSGGNQATDYIFQILHDYGLFLGFAFILAGIVYYDKGFDLSVVGLEKSDIGSLLKELGFAFIISQIVSRFLEAKSRERFESHVIAMQRQLARSIYIYLYDVDLPSDVFRLIERVFLEAEFIRNSMKANFNIYEISEAHLNPNLPKARRDELLTEHLIVDVQVTYFVQNLKNKRITFPGYFAVERDPSLAPDAKRESELTLKTGLIGLYVDKHPYSETELDGSVLRNAPEEITYSFDLEIEPGQRKYVSLTHRFLKFRRDKEIYKVGQICDGIDVTIQYPNAIQMHIEAVSSQESRRKRGPFEETEGTSPTVHRIDNGLIQFIVEEPLFPGNGLYIWWEPLKNQPTGSG